MRHTVALTSFPGLPTFQFQFLTVCDQKLDGGRSWDWGYCLTLLYLKNSPQCLGYTMGGDFVETFKFSEVVVVATNLCCNIGLIAGLARWTNVFLQLSGHRVPVHDILGSSNAPLFGNVHIDATPIIFLYFTARTTIHCLSKNWP